MESESVCGEGSAGRWGPGEAWPAGWGSLPSASSPPCGALGLRCPLGWTEALTGCEEARSSLLLSGAPSASSLPTSASSGGLMRTKTTIVRVIFVRFRLCFSPHLHVPGLPSFVMPISCRSSRLMSEIKSMFSYPFCTRTW